MNIVRLAISQSRRLAMCRTIPRSFSTYNITYIEPSGEPITISTNNGDESLMTLAVKNHVDLEGACDGQLACSTCHCILSADDYAQLQKTNPPTDDELDMLDTAFGLTDTSRLGCQLKLRDLPVNDMTVTLPKMGR